jgi:retinol dehydrogenase 12
VFGTPADVNSQVFIITGGYAGVGLKLSGMLYAKNATVYIAGRSASKADKAITSIKDEHPKSGGSLHFMEVDLSDLTKIKPGVDAFLSKETKLHWLNNNAGIMVPPKESKGAQGMDLQYQTNILGPFLLTKLLLPILKKTAAEEPTGTVRVSWAGSLAVVIQSPKFGVTFEKDGQLKEYNPPTAYGVTKASNYLLANEFAKRFAQDGVLHNVSTTLLFIFIH